MLSNRTSPVRTDSASSVLLRNGEQIAASDRFGSVGAEGQPAEKAAYKLIADKEGVEVDVVAKRAAKRNFERAKAGEWLKQGGKWKKK